MSMHTDHTTPKLAALVLAAGESARFGGRKQLADINGVPMIRHTLDRVAALPGIECFVVLGAFADEIRPIIGSDASIVKNDDWASGMGSSIAAGMTAILEQDRFDGVLIALCDQIELATTDYAKLIGTFDGNDIIATRHPDGLGVPAIFPRATFDTLAALSGTVGARKILNGPAHHGIGIDLPNARFDIDTKDDLKAVLKHPA